uniref:RNA-directed DNA polymerase n=1 Tax=Strongyloides papillosus TaxID=174720 RepID=A0A0N5C6R7_STREA
MTTSQKLMELMADMEVPPTLNSLKRDTKGHLDLNSLLSTIKTILPDDNVTIFKTMTMMLAKEYADLKTSMSSVITIKEENENMFTPQKFSQLLIETIRTVSENSLHTTSSMGNLNFTKPKLPPLPILQQKENPITFIEKFKNRFAGLTEQEGIALFPEFLEGPALIAYKAIETEKMVTLDAVLKEWISRYDPNMTPQRRVIKLEQILATAAPFTKDTPNIYMNKITAWIRELEKLKETLSYRSKMKYVLSAVRHLKRHPELTEKYLESEDTHEAYLKFQKTVLSALTKEMESQLPTKTKTDVPKQQREKFKNNDKFNNKNSILINELNSEINEIKDCSPVSLKGPVASINISLNNYSVEALIDSGANISIIATDTLKKIAKQSQHIEFLSEKNFIKIKDAQGNLLPVRDLTPSKNITPIKIELLTNTPVKSKIRQIPLPKLEILRDDIKDMYVKCIITKNKSPYNSRIVPIVKPDGSLRICIDYRLVNENIKQDARPLPHIDNILYKLAGKKRFTTIDLHKGYWQLPLHASAQELTAFSFDNKHYQFTVLPFGLSISPSIFQTIMNDILEDLDPDKIFIYLDDLLIATETEEEHWVLLNEVFIRLKKANLKINKNKCKICQSETPYLGFIISEKGLSADPIKIKKTLDFPTPRSKKQLQSFLGLANYFRRFIYRFSSLSKLLYDSLSNEKFNWTPQLENDFVTIKNELLNAPILSAPDIKKALSGEAPFELYTDASLTGIGAVLMQNKKIITFYNRGLRGSEKNYPPTDLESLAVVSALENLKIILFGAPIIVYSDHSALSVLFQKSDLSLRLLKWSLLIQTYDISFKYVRGKENILADALSRCVRPLPEQLQEEFDSPIICNLESTMLNRFPSKNEWLQLQINDKILKTVFTWLEDGIPKKSPSPELSPYLLL